MDRKVVTDGILYGTQAGVPFLAMQVAASAIDGRPAWAPLQPFSAVLLGEGPLTSPLELGVFVGGFIFHFVLSGIFGALYTLANARRFRPEERTRWRLQAGLGIAYGALLWLINLQVIARAFFPGFLDSSQLTQLVIHALFFGLPLALMYCGGERRQLSQGNLEHQAH